MMSEPIPVKVTRYRCPFCPRTRSSKTQMRKHIGRCWENPDAKGCKTCEHYEPGEAGDFATGYPGVDEFCGEGVSLDGRAACGDCGGYPESLPDCSTCGGNGAAVAPGPIVHCPKWERASWLAVPSGAVDTQ
jgi:hypothetical protein